MTTKLVQAALPEQVYEDLARLARRRKRPIKAVVQEAVEEYLRHEAPPDEDSLLAFVGTGRLRGSDWSERKYWRA